MRFAAAVSLLLGLAACHTPWSPSARNPAPPRPVRLEVDGPLAHEPSGFRFPERYAGFRRVAAYRYDAEGREIGVAYRDVRPGCAIDAVFDLYPVSAARSSAAASGAAAEPARVRLERELGSARAEWQRSRPGLELLSEGETTTPDAGGGLEGPFARFRQRGEISELRVFLYRGEWFLRYAFAYPEPCAGEADPKLAAMVERLPWAAALPPAPGTLCEDLAYAFFLVAENRDRGRSRREQETMVRESIRTPFVENPEQTRRHLLRVVDTVYRSPRATPEEIEAGVLERCVVDDEGHAVVRSAAGAR